MTVDDIEHVVERGRWWLVGSAWNSTSAVENGLIATKDENASKFHPSLLALARKAKMNTTVRRDIFCALMSSTVTF